MVPPATGVWPLAATTIAMTAAATSDPAMANLGANRVSRWLRIVRASEVFTWGGGVDLASGNISAISVASSARCRLPRSSQSRP